MATSYQVVDLGFGDAGKGRVVDALVRKSGARLVVRYNGGAQAAHNVLAVDRPTGRVCAHTFRQYGAGTLAGADTLLAAGMLVNPVTLLKEADELISKNAITVMYIEGAAMVTTPYHVALNRLREMARGNSPHGSCGMGIGETVAHSIAYPEHVIRAGECAENAEYIAQKLQDVRLDLYGEAMALAAHAVPSPEASVKRYTATFAPGTEKEFARIYVEFGHRVRFVSRVEAVQMVASQDTVFEGAQGVLIDQEHGFLPYVTWTDTTLKNARKLAQEAGVQRVRIGVTRPYMVRHGPGPLPSESSLVNVVDKHNVKSRWQGAVRYGWLDLQALHYARLCLGENLDYLAITHADEIRTRSTWGYVSEYERPWQDEPVETRTKAYADAGPRYSVAVHVSYLDALASEIKRGIAPEIGMTVWGPRTTDNIVYNIRGLC